MKIIKYCKLITVSSFLFLFWSKLLSVFKYTLEYALFVTLSSIQFNSIGYKRKKSSLWSLVLFSSSFLADAESKMSDGALQILDGTHLRNLDLSLPDDPTLTGAHILDIAHSRVSASLFALPLSDALKASALTRLHLPDADAFLSAEYDHDKAAQILRDYIAAIADELKGLLTLFIVICHLLHLLFDDACIIGLRTCWMKCELVVVVAEIDFTIFSQDP